MTYKAPATWRLRRPRYRLMGSVCLHCGFSSFPPRSFCPQCAANPTLAAEGLPESGAPPGFKISIRLPSPPALAIQLAENTPEASP
jgi:hypothetical protein